MQLNRWSHDPCTHYTRRSKGQLDPWPVLVWSKLLRPTAPSKASSSMDPAEVGYVCDPIYPVVLTAWSNYLDSDCGRSCFLSYSALNNSLISLPAQRSEILSYVHSFVGSILSAGVRKRSRICTHGSRFPQWNPRFPFNLRVLIILRIPAQTGLRNWLLISVRVFSSLWIKEISGSKTSTFVVWSSTECLVICPL